MGDISLEQSSERLRMALPLMARNSVPVTPENYWVWYQYVAGVNEPLREAIDRLLEKDQAVDEAVTKGLYRRYIETQEQEFLTKAGDSVRRLLETVSNSLSSADSEVTRYGESLGEFAEELTTDIPVDRFKLMVDALSKSTQRMHEGSEKLHANLDESRKEVKALKEELKKAKALATIDPLTKLLNRTGLIAQLERLRNASVATNASLLIADIDHFKRVNDTYGHIFGDKIIKVVATSLKELGAETDIAARFGGEEFIVILPNATIDNAIPTCEKIRAHVENGRIFNPKTKKEIERITISIGVTAFDLDEDIDTVIERADAALYRAKENGRNRVEVAGVESAQQAAVGA